MGQATANPDGLQVAVYGELALVEVSGRGSFQTGPALKQFGMTAIEHGCRTLVFDMDRCIGMDSTFMGVLAGLALRLERESLGRVVMINLSRKTMSSLTTLGLDQLLKLYLAGDTDEALREQIACISDFSGLSSLETSTADKRLTLETILEAHQQLAGVSPENFVEFKNVIEYVSQDLQQLDAP